MNKIILENGEFAGTTHEQLRDTVANFIASPFKNTLVVHFHGGLVNLPDGEAIATRLQSFYEDAGAYPLFILWKAGLLELLQSSWDDLVKRNIFTLLRERVLQLIIGKLDQEPGERGVTIEVPTISVVRAEIREKEAAGEVPFADRDAEANRLDGQLSPGEQELLKQPQPSPHFG